MRSRVRDRVPPTHVTRWSTSLKSSLTYKFVPPPDHLLMREVSNEVIFPAVCFSADLNASV